MKILRITGAISGTSSNITITEADAEEKGKTFCVKNDIRWAGAKYVKWAGAKYVKKKALNIVLSLTRNEISDTGGIVSFYLYCLPKDEEAGVSDIKRALTECMNGILNQVNNMKNSFKSLSIERREAEDPYQTGVNMKKTSGQNS